MKINQVHHIAINTLDIEQSVAFYREMFGFTEVQRADVGSCILVYMEICEGSYLELFDLKGGCIKGTAAEDLQGLRHIAFDVTDIESWNDALKAKHADFVMELCEMEPIRKKGLLIRDPNGAIIELCEDM